jgi:hypothetical protein
MCTATLTPHYPVVAAKHCMSADRSDRKSPKGTICLYDKNADIMEFLLNKIYGHRSGVVISNVRLFSLLFLLDWTAAIHSDAIEPVTATGQWLRGLASPYSLDYYTCLLEHGAFKDKPDVDEIWRSKRRILFHVNFTGEERNISFPEAAVLAVTSVSDLVREIGQKHHVSFNAGQGQNEIDTDKFKVIDAEIIDYVYCLDPLLKSNIPIDGDLNLLDYAKKHREAFSFT